MTNTTKGLLSVLLICFCVIFQIYTIAIFKFFDDVHYISESLKLGTVCTIAMAPDEYLKENKNLIEYRAQELSKKRCGK